MPETLNEIGQECRRLAESCLYTSASLFVWLRFLRWWRVGFAIVPLVLGSLASWNLLTTSDLPGAKFLAAAFAFVAGLAPTVWAALKLDDYIGETKYLAAEFKNLQDRFRQVAVLNEQRPFTESKGDLESLTDRLERARGHSTTPPEWCFKRARRKIKAGHYDFDVDATR